MNKENRTDIIEGRNPVMEALRSGRTIDKILVQTGEKHGSVIKILKMAKDMRITISYAEKAKLDLIASTKAHQGVIAYVAAIIISLLTFDFASNAPLKIPGNTNTLLI